MPSHIGLKLGLITNGSVRMQSRKLQCLALAPMFDTILISDAEGIGKPDPRIFHRALERLNTSPARSVVVGDHPEVDVAGARAAGMQTIWRRDPHESRMIDADGVIDELSDLLTWLELGPTTSRTERRDSNSVEPPVFPFVVD